MTATPAPTAEPIAAALAVRPDALLLDFGGVVFETEKHPEGRRRAAELVRERLSRAGHDLDAAAVEASMAAGLDALKHWKHAMSRTIEPVELTHRALWEDFLLADQSEAVRAVAAGDGRELMAAINPLLSDHRVRPGAAELLRLARGLGVRVGIVSNAHSGLSHRNLMRRFGLDVLVDVQLYSDEVGIRKPHPGMIRRAAAALGTSPERCWYVGDTQDRDVQAGRRAGTGAVILTRSKHTDRPPFPVADKADAVFDTPEGLVPALAQSKPAAASPVTPPAPEAASVPRALLLDQGGVLVTSIKTPEALAAFTVRTAARLRAAGHQVTDLLMADALRYALDAYRRLKRTPESGSDGEPVWREITPAVFWGEHAAAALPPSAREWLLAEATALTEEYARAKSRARLREGVVDLLEWCRSEGVLVGIVSNTVCGREGRRRLDDAGVAHLVGANAYSDEVGRRKPDPALVLAATRALGVDPAECWFVGDKPWRDVKAARAAGVGTAVIVEGGSPSASELDAAADRPDLVLESMSAVHKALKAARSAA
ncbi:HAD family hydrolase [Glycomyces sp. NRRL B-16210]|uniref:HAD family hydrolase n=1 Tax=Glycomyces sp. NRRL B-16210 TaxID=1463821 RepID=UPI00068B9184|nr:HAD family hydrolase [Glycomyces sp. NRRL B-16210]